MDYKKKYLKYKLKYKNLFNQKKNILKGGDMTSKYDCKTVQEIKDKLFNEHKKQLFVAYAPWCPHCKVLKPDLLKLYESEEDKLITVDSTQLNIPKEEIDIPILGYPSIFIIEMYDQADDDTIKVIKGGSEKFFKVKDYNSNRTYNDFIEALKTD